MYEEYEFKHHDKLRNIKCKKCNKCAWCDRKKRIYWNSLYSYAYCEECGYILGLNLKKLFYGYDKIMYNL